MRNLLKKAFGAPTREQRAYDNGFLSGAVAVIGCLLIHQAAERLRERHP